jgi:hypothetical protein
MTGWLRQLQRLRHIVRGFFGDRKLAYITAADEVDLLPIALGNLKPS